MLFARLEDKKCIQSCFQVALWITFYGRKALRTLVTTTTSSGNLSCFGQPNTKTSAVSDWADCLGLRILGTCCLLRLSVKAGPQGKINQVDLPGSRETSQGDGFVWMDAVFVGNKAESNKYLHELAMYPYILDMWAGLNKPRVLTKTLLRMQDLGRDVKFRVL